MGLKFSRTTGEDKCEKIVCIYVGQYFTIYFMCFFYFVALSSFASTTVMKNCSNSSFSWFWSRSRRSIREKASPGNMYDVFCFHINLCLCKIYLPSLKQLAIEFSRQHWLSDTLEVFKALPPRRQEKQQALSNVGKKRTNEIQLYK